VSITNSLSNLSWQGVEGRQDLQLYSMYAGANFQNFFGLELADGRWFREGARLDSASVVINETAAKAMQLDNPVGKWIDFWGNRVTIVGLIKDFHFQSLHNEIKPLIFIQSTDWFPTMYIKSTGENAAKAITATEQIFKQYSPNEVFEYEFLDETFSQLYAKESRAGKLFLLFALIAIIISCLGIFGLATYTAERRFKEISIRKVLGASVSSIVHLLSKDFLQLVIFALVIAVPIAWYFMDGWLSNFAFRIDMDWWVFALSGFVAIVIAFITVGLQSFRAAIANPAENLKNE
ncbi:MAG: FtsX-like permease family protein, partial [Bacteroidota bacterium]